MTTAETLAKARAITQGTTCFVVPVGGRFKVCRRVAGRVIPIGYRSDAEQLCAWLRKLTKTKGQPAPSQPAISVGTHNERRNNHQPQAQYCAMGT